MRLFVPRSRNRRRFIISCSVLTIFLGSISLLLGFLDQSNIPRENRDRFGSLDHRILVRDNSYHSTRVLKGRNLESASIHTWHPSATQHINSGNQGPHSVPSQPDSTITKRLNERRAVLRSSDVDLSRYFKRDPHSDKSVQAAFLSPEQSEELLDLRPEGRILRDEVPGKGDKQLTEGERSNVRAPGIRLNERVEVRDLPGDLLEAGAYHNEEVIDKVIIDTDDDGDYDESYDTDQYDGYPPNSVFKEGDFDEVPTDVSLKPKLPIADIPSRVHDRKLNPGDMRVNSDYMDTKSHLGYRSQVEQLGKQKNLQTSPLRPLDNLQGLPEAKTGGKFEKSGENGPCVGASVACQLGELASKLKLPSKPDSHQGRSLSHPANTGFDKRSSTNLSLQGTGRKSKKSEIQPSLLASDTVNQADGANSILQLYQHDSDGVHGNAKDTWPLLHKIETQIPIQDGFGIPGYSDSGPATQLQTPDLPRHPSEVRSQNGVPLIVDKIYWSDDVEQLLPTGVTDDHFQHFLYKLSSQPVSEMQAPMWNRCGRPKNQFIVLQDGTQLCARYRHPHDKLVRGEILSYYLSRMLGMDNVPLVVLSQLNTSSFQWRGQNLSQAEWQEGQVVALIEWIDGMENEKSRVKMPSLILEAYTSGKPLNVLSPSLTNLTASQLVNIVQWGDMILFDYITGHYDRVASMQDGADREGKPGIIKESIRNLRKIWQTGQIWLIDNESGLLDAYELLYQGGPMGERFIGFHKQMLFSLCLFHRKTVQKIRELSTLEYPHSVLENYARQQDPVYSQLDTEFVENDIFKTHFHKRLKEVLAWVDSC